MADLRTNFADAAQSTLTASLSASSTTINVADTSSFPAVPFYVTVDPGNDSKREIVLVDDAKTSTTFTLSSATKRGQGDTSDVAHDSGAVVALVPVSPQFEDLHDRVDAVSDHGSLSGLADDDHTQYALADGTRGDFEASGAVTTHEGAVDPHSQYLTATEGNAAYVAKAGDTMTGPLLLPDGSGAAPALGFSSNGDVGLYLGGGLNPTIVIDGTAIGQFNNSGLKLFVGDVIDSANKVKYSRAEAKEATGSAASESVTWTTAFAATPVVVASLLNATAVGFAMVESRSTTGATVATYKHDGTASAWAKQIIATEAT